MADDVTTADDLSSKLAHPSTWTTSDCPDDDGSSQVFADDIFKHGYVTKGADHTWHEAVPADATSITDDGGLRKKILKAGDANGGKPHTGAMVQIHYVGTILSDGSKFESSRDGDGTFSFVIGSCSAIRAWDLGVATMHLGEVAELYCNADYGYGNAMVPGRIPHRAALKFEIELIEWGEPEPPRKSESQGIDSFNVCGPTEQLTAARKLKNEGGEAFKLTDWPLAIDAYDRAAEFVTELDDFQTSEQKQEASELLGACLLNSAQCAPHAPMLTAPSAHEPILPLLTASSSCIQAGSS